MRLVANRHHLTDGDVDPAEVRVDRGDSVAVIAHRNAGNGSGVASQETSLLARERLGDADLPAS